MDIRGTIIGTAVGLLVGGATLTTAQASEPAPDLRCTTVPDCQVVIDRLYSTAVDLGAEVNDHRRIRGQLERTAERRRDRIERQADLIAKLRTQVRAAR